MENDYLFDFGWIRGIVGSVALYERGWGVSGRCGCWSGKKRGDKGEKRKKGDYCSGREKHFG